MPLSRSQIQAIIRDDIIARYCSVSAEVHDKDGKFNDDNNFKRKVSYIEPYSGEKIIREARVLPEYAGKSMVLSNLDDDFETKEKDMVRSDFEEENGKFPLNEYRINASYCINLALEIELRYKNKEKSLNGLNKILISKAEFKRKVLRVVNYDNKKTEVLQVLNDEIERFNKEVSRVIDTHNDLITEYGEQFRICIKQYKSSIQHIILRQADEVNELEKKSLLLIFQSYLNLLDELLFSEGHELSEEHFCIKKDAISYISKDIIDNELDHSNEFEIKLADRVYSDERYMMKKLDKVVITRNINLEKIVRVLNNFKERIQLGAQ